MPLSRHSRRAQTLLRTLYCTHAHVQCMCIHEYEYSTARDTLHSSRQAVGSWQLALALALATGSVGSARERSLLRAAAQPALCSASAVLRICILNARAHKCSSLNCTVLCMRLHALCQGASRSAARRGAAMPLSAVPPGAVSALSFGLSSFESVIIQCESSRVESRAAATATRVAACRGVARRGAACSATRCGASGLVASRRVSFHRMLIREQVGVAPAPAPHVHSRLASPRARNGRMQMQCAREYAYL